MKEDSNTFHMTSNILMFINEILIFWHHSYLKQSRPRTIEYSWYMVWDSWYMVYFGGCGEGEKLFFCLSETGKRNETPPPSSESLWPTLPFSYSEIVWFYLPLEWGLGKIPLIWFIGESYFGYMVYLHPWYMVFPIIWFIFDGQNREPYMREPV